MIQTSNSNEETQAALAQVSIKIAYPIQNEKEYIKIKIQTKSSYKENYF